jgi:hypothetical protein
MVTLRTRVVSIYVDKSKRHWIVRDADGNFWALPNTETPWEDRLPYVPTEEAELEPIPGHYGRVLGLPY